MGDTQNTSENSAVPSIEFRVPNVPPVSSHQEWFSGHLGTSQVRRKKRQRGAVASLGDHKMMALAGEMMGMQWYQWEFQDPKRPYKAIFYGDVPLHRPYIGLIYGRYLQFRILKIPLMIWRFPIHGGTPKSSVLMGCSMKKNIQLWGTFHVWKPSYVMSDN